MNNATIEPGDHDGDETDDAAGAATDDATARAVAPNRGFGVTARPLDAATGLADATVAAARGDAKAGAGTAALLAAEFRRGSAGSAAEPSRAGALAPDAPAADLPPTAEAIVRFPRLEGEAFADAPGESAAEAPTLVESACATGDVAASAAPRPRVTAEAPNHAYGASRRPLPRRVCQLAPWSGETPGQSLFGVDSKSWMRMGETFRNVPA